MRVYSVRRKLFGKYKEVEIVRATNERSAHIRFTQQTIPPKKGRYAIFYQGNKRLEFKI